MVCCVLYTPGYDTRSACGAKRCPCISGKTVPISYPARKPDAEAPDIHASHLSDLDYADDTALFVDTIQEAERLLHKVESASKSSEYFSIQAKQNTCISTGLLVIVYTLQMGVKWRK